MRANGPRACGQFGPQGLDWQDLCRGPLNIATYYISCWPYGFREDLFSHYVYGSSRPLGRGQFEPHRLDCQDLCRGPLNIETY